MQFLRQQLFLIFELKLSKGSFFVLQTKHTTKTKKLCSFCCGLCVNFLMLYKVLTMNGIRWKLNNNSKKNTGIFDQLDRITQKTKYNFIRSSPSKVIKNQNFVNFSDFINNSLEDENQSEKISKS